MGPTREIQGDRTDSNGALLRTIVGATFRANPEYSLVLFDRLPADQQEMLRDLTKDPEFYGVLVASPGSTRKTKSACQSTALLLYTLTNPGPLPSYVQTTLGDHANQAVAELVLDGVLEIEHDGRFVSGSSAYDIIYQPQQPNEPRAPMPDLTRRALEYAQMLELDDSNMLSARLYAYNRVPFTARWQHLFPDSAAVAAYLGFDRHGELRPLLENNWERIRTAPQTEGWFQWTSPEKRAAAAGGDTGFKLYVSPTPDSMPGAFKAVVKCLVDSAAHHFKVGEDAFGMLRPDKIVIYFRSFEALQETAAAIAARLEGCPTQGVPFTAAIGESGLLSWGVDPPPQEGVLAWQERESWRLWVTNRVATAMVAARRAPDSRLEPWQFALERLRLDNVDTYTWTPLPGFGRAVATEMG